VNHGKRPMRRFNFIDYLILLFLLCAAAAIGFRIFTIQSFPEDADEARALFRVSGVYPEVAEAIAAEDTLILADGHEARLEDLRITPSKISAVVDGEIRELDSSLTYSVEGVLSFTGKQTENGFFLGGRLYFVPGTVVNATGKNSAFPLTVIAFLT